MIKKNIFGYESFECSKCGFHVDEFDEFCNDCGHEFINNNIGSSLNSEKHKAIDYTEGRFNNYNVLYITLENPLKGLLNFIVPETSQIALRTKYYVFNGDSNFLEDGLYQEKLIEMEIFENMVLQNKRYFVDKKLLS
jgi:RNA polymerase subunit RPABC4/transcription elongation factor Spt4